MKMENLVCISVEVTYMCLFDVGKISVKIRFFTKIGHLQNCILYHFRGDM